MKQIIRLFAIIVFFTFISFFAKAQNYDALANAVKQEYISCWNNYKVNAWGYDEIKPITGKPFNWYNESLYMTMIDALDGLYIMGYKKEGDEVINYLEKNATWDKNISVSAFETNIRLVGGLLSTYEITHNKKLLNLAQNLADRLLPVFNSPTGMPYTTVNLKTGEAKGKDSNPAEIGTYIIEFGTLSKLTGDKKYYAYAKRALDTLYSKRSKINLVGEGIDVETGTWTNSNSHVSGGIDSYYEYLLKGALLFKDADLKNMWDTYKAALDKYSLDKVKSGWWYGYVNMNTGERVYGYYGALDAFFPAVLVLDHDMKTAGELESSCFKMWNLYNLEPEVIDYEKMEVVKGDEGYALRPEIIESAYYLYTKTKDKKYLKMGEKIFDDLKKYCKEKYGYTEIKNVITKEKSDDQPSFFFAETMKYLYLLFSAPSANHFKFDNYIFNTEAHPIKKDFGQK